MNKMLIPETDWAKCLGLCSRESFAAPSAPSRFNLGVEACLSSHLNFGIEAFELHSGVVDAKLPIDGALFRIRSFRPGRDFALKFRRLTNATITQTLTRHATQFAFRDI